MSDVRLNLSTFAGGELEDDFERALEVVVGSFDNEDLRGRPREIVIKLTFVDEAASSSNHVKTSHNVAVKLPTRTRFGIAWRRDGTLRTSTLCRADAGMQMSIAIEDEDGKTIPIDRRRRKDK